MKSAYVVCFMGTALLQIFRLIEAGTDDSCGIMMIQCQENQCCSPVPFGEICVMLSGESQPCANCATNGGCLPGLVCVKQCIFSRICRKAPEEPPGEEPPPEKPPGEEPPPEEPPGEEPPPEKPPGEEPPPEEPAGEEPPPEKPPCEEPPPKKPPCEEPPPKKPPG